MPSRPTDRPTSADAPRKGERIAKLLARAGVASRREVERMIAEGRVARDGVAIDTPATVLTSLHGVTVDGTPVAAPPPARLFAYYKPPGLLVTERDPRGRPTIYDRLPAGLPRVVPVGRLDLATEGLLLLTTDGGLKRQLELPATGVERTYRARAYGPVSQAQLEELIDGIEIDGIRYGSIDANLERRTGANTWIELTLTEGKNREVRRVLEHLGLEVSRLIRTRYGPFVLADMPPGAIGEIRQHDLVAFRQSLKSGKGGDKDARVMAVPLAEAVDAPATPMPEQSRRTVPTPFAPSPSKGRSSSPRPAKNSASTSSARTDRGNAPAKTLRRSDDRQAPDGLTRSGSGKAKRPSAAEHPHPSGASRLPPSPAGRGKGAGVAGGKGEGERARTHDDATRPPRPQRKPGWARPKPRPGSRPGPRGKR